MYKYSPYSKGDNIELVKPAQACPEFYRRGFAPILILIIGIIIGVGGVIALKYFYTPKLNDSIVPLRRSEEMATPSPLPTPDITVNPDQVGASWKTYTNKRYKYTFKYPSNGIVTESSAEWSEGNSEIVTVLDINYGRLRIEGNIGGRGIASEKTKEVTIGGVDTVKMYESVTDIIIKAISSPKGDEIYFSITLPTSNTNDVDATFDQILSTFKFTE